MIGDSETISREPFIKGLLEYCTNNGEVCSAHEYIQSKDKEQGHMFAAVTGFNLEIFVWGGGMVSPHTMHGEYLVTCICICQ